MLHLKISLLGVGLFAFCGCYNVALQIATAPGGELRRTVRPATLLGSIETTDVPLTRCAHGVRSVRSRRDWLDALIFFAVSPAYMQTTLEVECVAAPGDLADRATRAARRDPSADIIEMKDGTQVEGRIAGQTADTVTIVAGGERRRIAKRLIRRLRFGVPQ